MSRDFSPIRSWMRELGLPDNRETYISMNWPADEYGPDEELPAELEAELPADFRRDKLDENILTDKEQ